MRHWILAVLLAISCAAARASEGPPPVLHITTYVSPSGEYRLTVDPSRLNGQGKGTYWLVRNGKELYRREIEYTFWEAAVADDGVAAGVAYTQGWRGMDFRSPLRGSGHMVIAILNPDGSERMKKSFGRQQKQLHTAPEPVSAGSFLDPDAGRYVVRFQNEGMSAGERWDSYDLATGRALEPVTVAAPAAGGENSYLSIISADAVPGTGLTAVAWSWMQWEQEARHQGLRLSLVDRQGAEVWSLARPDEFTSVERYSPWMLGKVVELKPAARGAVVYKSYAEQAAVEFSVTGGKDGAPWAVTEAGRAAAEVKMRDWETGPVALTEVKLEPRGVVKLDAGADAAAALNIMEFEIDGQGRFGFVSREKDYAFVLLGADGGPVAHVPLGVEYDENWAMPTAAWCGGDRWLVVWGNYGDKPEVRALRVDASAKTVTPVDGFTAPNPGVNSMVSGAGEAGVAVSGDWRDRSIAMLDPAGKARWVVESPGSTQAVALRASGEVGVLVQFPDKVVVLESDGDEGRTIDLAAALGRKPNYVSGLWADAGDGWVLHDFNGSPPVYRLDAGGAVKAKFVPRYKDGRTFTIRGGVRPDPQGRLWTSDGAALLRLDEGGVVDTVIGRAPDSEALTEIRGFTIDHRGALYAVDGRTNAVHVFDHAGKRERMLKALPTDFSVGVGIGSITVAGDGSVYCRPDSIMGGGQYLKFAADGTRQGFEPRFGNEVREDWWYRPGSMTRVVTGYEAAYLVDEAGKTLATIERRADRKWLDKVGDAAVAADGSFAILASSGLGLMSDVPPSVTVFSASGEPLRTLDLPMSFHFARAAYNGRLACVASGGDVVLFDAVTGGSRVFHIPEAGEKEWLTPYIDPVGGELWILKTEAKEIQRYALPAGIDG